MMSAVSRSSSSRPCGILRCVERCWPSAAQARRSETPSSQRTCSMQARRRAGLSNFPGKPPAGSACPASAPRSLCATERSRSPGPSDASADQTSDRRTRYASDSTSPPSHQSSGSHPRSASPVTSGHQLAATSQRSLPVCASSPFQSSSVAKPYFESDHFIGGGPLLWASYDAHSFCQRAVHAEVCPHWLCYTSVHRRCYLGPRQDRVRQCLQEFIGQAQAKAAIARATRSPQPARLAHL